MTLRFLNHPIYQDPWIYGPHGPEPRWAPDSGKPWKKGQSKGAFIWPRDKKMNGPPVKSWQRWKDVFSGKGPAIYVGDRTQFGPSRRVWSNWLDEDNLGYQEHYNDATPRSRWKGKRYDFNARKYTADWDRPNVFSDVKWGRDPTNPEAGDIPLYFRSPSGLEWTRYFGDYYPGIQNTPFGYRLGTNQWDWARPFPCGYWWNQLKR
ncbi:hypothetical protein MMC10_004256 [Thelotrema lepadinum]|nr:hypothetical protein [Thelotrema lepadinum]